MTDDHHPNARSTVSALSKSVCITHYRKSTYTANVPALTGIALNSVGPVPFQNPRIPSALHVCLKQSLILTYLFSAPNPSLCILLFTTSSG